MMVVTVNNEALKTALVEKLDELKLSLQRTSEDIHIEFVPDELDNVVSRSTRELALAGRDRNSVTARRVLAALKRLEHGEYGTCVMCESDIAPKRLVAIPWADKCLVCQEAYDRAVIEQEVSAVEDVG